MKISKKYLIISAVAIGIAVITINIVFQLTKEKNYTANDIITKDDSKERHHLNKKKDNKIPTDVLKFVDAYRYISKNSDLQGSPLDIPQNLVISEEKNSDNEIMNTIYFLNDINKNAFSESTFFKIVLNENKTQIKKVIYAGPFDLNTCYVSLGALNILNDPSIDDLTRKIDSYINEQELSSFDETVSTNGWNVNVQLNASQFVPPMNFVLEKM
ncbi:hypothetical protein [Bacillus cytotoxicus]|uniref:hypothetical protein n=1 Tax=Bacillus cytotoxicus TaxID=580165 RepID=UPI001AED8C34|nr:hypothetical protein [Bacillus cytotoxicus]QTR79182.1 hypothetical protein JC773_00920 [Bacillus cytotoxicus]